jgi:hypothetical protein
MRNKLGRHAGPDSIAPLVTAFDPYVAAANESNLYSFGQWPRIYWSNCHRSALPSRRSLDLGMPDPQFQIAAQDWVQRAQFLEVRIQSALNQNFMPQRGIAGRALR